MSFIRQCPEGLALKLTVQPRSSRNMVAGIYNNTLKIKVTAPPVDGAANKMCIKFLSRYLAVSKSSLEIISGSTSRVKTILLRCNNSADASVEKKRLDALAQSILIID